MFSHRPGEGGKIDLGNVLVDAGAFSLNTSTSRIYTAENLTLSAGPATGTGGHVEVVQPRGTAYLDLLSGDGSTASGAQINLKSSGPRRRGAGDYTVAVTEDGAFAITVGRPASSKLARFEDVRVGVLRAALAAAILAYVVIYQFAFHGAWTEICIQVRRKPTVGRGS